MKGFDSSKIKNFITIKDTVDEIYNNGLRRNAAVLTSHPTEYGNRSKKIFAIALI